jgi:hypothetical protein
MSEEAARIYERACRNDVPAPEAWADLELLAEEIDWDTEQLLSDSDSNAGTTDRELSR